MYPIRNLIAIMETTNATTIPTIRIITSVPVKEKPNFRIFRRLAPNMTGIPRKKVNSAATVREVPARIPPIMVEPERDVPGTTERYWLLMSLTHYICVTGTGGYRSFQDGYHRICSAVHQEKYQYLFLCAKASDDFEAFMKLAG